MSSLLYLSEVFCPWCYGFAGVMDRVQREYGLPLRVLCGCLRDDRIALSELASKMTNARAFFDRLAATTGQKISEDFIRMLEGENEGIFMDSPQAGRIFYALKAGAPERAHEIMEALQHMFYGQGKDVLDRKNVLEIGGKFSMNLQELEERLDSGESAEKADAEAEEGLDILGDIVLYPCLYFVRDDGEKELVARGFVPWDEVRKKLDALTGKGETEDCRNQNAACVEKELQGAACGLDGVCS